ncbi:MAG TPA: hypothetical protein ENH82_20200 [bacterium]|nr:hypothetical protein [bacterium]
MATRLKLYVKKLVCLNPTTFQYIILDTAIKDYDRYVQCRKYYGNVFSLKSFVDWLKTEL